MRHFKEWLGEFFLSLAGKFNGGGLLYAVGELTGELKTPDSLTKLVIPPQKRLITNTGLRDLVAGLTAAFSTATPGTNVLNDSSYYKLCHAWNLGSGTNPESFTDTDLQTRIFTNNVLADNYSFQVDTAQHLAQLVSIKNFNFTASYTIREVGLYTNIGATGAGTRLFDRIVLQNPISVNAGDVLTLSYTLRVQRPT